MSLIKDLGIGQYAIEKYLKDVYRLKKTMYEDFKNGTITESVNMFGSEEEKLDYQLKNVEGDFICRYSKLASVENFPEHITGSLDISFTDIRSLLSKNPDNQSIKMKVDGDFVCTGCNLTEYNVRSFCNVGGNIYC